MDVALLKGVSYKLIFYFKFMKKIICTESYIKGKEEINHYASFIIEPLDSGQSITFGNALRRTLLSEISGYSITGIRINNLRHEFENSNQIREDTLEIILNIKEIIIKGPLFLRNRNFKSKIIVMLSVDGPAIITAGLLNASIKKFSNFLNIINPSLYICTLTNKSKFHLELDITKSKGYKIAEKSKFINLQTLMLPLRPCTILIDSIYTPVKQANFNIKKINDTKGNIKESLCINILTNGAVTPLKCLKESLKLLLELFFPFFLDSNFLILYNKLRLRKNNKEND